MPAAVYLDRDNTIIDNDGDLGDPKKVELRQGVAEGLRELRRAGFTLVVVTNQGGVARGKYSESDVESVNQRVAQLVDETAGMSGLIDRFYYCPYHPEGTVEEYRRDHPWRKPMPGMLLQAARDFQIDCGRSWMVGDQPRDVEAGRTAGCRTILLGANGEEAESCHPTAAAKTFGEAVGIIIDQSARHEDATATAGDGHGPVLDAEGYETMRRAILDLTEELRSRRLRRTEFTVLKMTAGLLQLGVVLLALLGLLQLDDLELFVKWMVGAALAQLTTIALVLLDQNT